jgi:NAD(P)-dependent dehydrogenase (short-subunit alcohol dehydrogenase family)
MTRCEGRADLELARELKQRGHVVYATAPQVGSVGPLQAIGVRVDAVNLTNWDTVQAFMKRLQDDNAVVDVVINHIDLGTARQPTPADALRQQFDIDMVAAFATLNLFGFQTQHRKRVANVIRAPDWSSMGLGSPFRGGRKLMRQLSEAQRETLGPFGVEVLTIEASGAPKLSDATAEARRQFRQQLVDAILAIDPPALSKIDGPDLLPAILRPRRKLLA